MNTSVTPAILAAAAQVVLPPHLDPDVILPTLTALVRWGFDVEQPDTAILQHHGMFLLAPPTANRRYTFVPVVNGSPLVIVDVVDSAWDRDKNVHGAVLHPDELDCLYLALDTLGVPVVDRWNGDSDVTGYLLLGGRQAHPSLLAAVNRHYAGCLTHPDKNMFCGCGWYQAGYAHVVAPIAPEQP